jgi:hypothetical protein
LRPLGLAASSGLSVFTVLGIESGMIDARVETLRRIATTIEAWAPTLGSVEEVTTKLVGERRPRVAAGRGVAVTQRHHGRRRFSVWLDAPGRRG